MFHLLLTAFIGFVSCQNYILTPKESGNVNVQSISNEHHLKMFVDFGDLQMYTVSKENLMMYKSTLTQFYHIEEDMPISLNKQNVFIKKSIPWHLNRVTSQKLSTNDTFVYSQPGSCHVNSDVQIDTYIVDTGIDIAHSEFNGRAVWGANMVDSQNTDCNSHGTHVAGLVGSMHYGGCVDARLHAVKVLDCEGSGTLSGVIRGIEWVFKQHARMTKMNSKRVKSIINMSLGGGFSRAVNTAVEYALNNDENFYVVVAAGNEDSDACKTSPASAKGVLTVMASANDDSRAWFSNWGKCSDVYAPGVDIMSTIPNGKTAVYSGTSMASPVMVGVLNHYLDMYPDMNMNDIKNKILEEGTKNIILNNKKNTKNVLVYLDKNL